jgi:hypothetical protein
VFRRIPNSSNQSCHSPDADNKMKFEWIEGSRCSRMRQAKGAYCFDLGILAAKIAAYSALRPFHGVPEYDSSRITRGRNRGILNGTGDF